MLDYNNNNFKYLADTLKLLHNLKYLELYLCWN